MSIPLEVQLIAEVDLGQPVSWTAVAPAFHLANGRHQCSGGGPSPTEALTNLSGALATACSVEPDEVLSAPPMERVEEE